MSYRQTFRLRGVETKYQERKLVTLASCGHMLMQNIRNLVCWCSIYEAKLPWNKYPLTPLKFILKRSFFDRLVGTSQTWRRAAELQWRLVLFIWTWSRYKILFYQFYQLNKYLHHHSIIWQVIILIPFPICRNRCKRKLALVVESKGAKSGPHWDGRAALLWKRIKRETAWSILAQGSKNSHLNPKFSCHGPAWVTRWEAVGPHTRKPTQAGNSFRQAASWLDLTACGTSGPAE